MIKISLTESERAVLQQLRLNRKSNVGERAYYVLLAGQGLSSPQIASRLNRNIITIRLWLHRYIELGIEGLESHKPPGRPEVKGKLLRSALDELLSQSPKAYGYQEAGWQVNTLKDYFEKQGCQVCDNTLVKALKKEGYVYKRFSKTMPKDAPSASEKLAVISDIVESIQTEQKNKEVLFADESHFSNQPYVSRGWFKQGKKK